MYNISLFNHRFGKFEAIALRHVHEIILFLKFFVYLLFLSLLFINNGNIKTLLFQTKKASHWLRTQKIANKCEGFPVSQLSFDI